jgi:hypothetical protein
MLSDTPRSPAFLSRVAASRWSRRVAPLLAVAVLSLTAIHPSTFGSLPDSPDGQLHLYRLVAFDHAVRQGDLWPRYAPGALFGYGAPIFNFYSPLTLYPMEALHLLGLGFLDALLVGTILYTLLGALGAYRLGDSWGGPLAGVVTAAAYTYAPYVLYDWPRRGAVAEYAALMLLPWLLWAFRRLTFQGRRRDFILAAGLFAALILTHNITALVGAGLIAIYGLFLWWHSDDPPQAFVRLALALVFGVGLAAFFWLPALIETRYVFIERVSTAVSSLDFHNNFQPLADTLAPPLTADLTQLHPPVRRTLGYPQIGLALISLGLTGLAGRLGIEIEERDRRHAWVLIGLLIGLLFLTTRASTPLWEALPLAHYIQFPWRLLGPASLCLALLAGLGAAWLSRLIPWDWLRGVGGGLCALLVIGWALPWLYGLYLPDPPAGAIRDVQDFERRTGWLAMTAAGEYVPRWMRELPDTDRLAGLYAQADVIPRLQPNDSVTLEEATWRAMGAALTLDAEDDATLAFDWTYYPGWWAALDGERIPVEPTSPDGLLEVAVPAGEHTLVIGFRPTALRLGATIASLVFLVGLIPAMYLRRIWRAQEMAAPIGPLEPLWIAAGAALLVGLIAFAGKALVFDKLETPIRRARFASGLEAGVDVPVQASFGEAAITLLGYDLDSAAVRSGGESRLNLYWQVGGEQMVSEDYSSVIYLRDSAGNIVLQTGSQHPGGWPTSRWVPGFYVQEGKDLMIPPGTPPGEYHLQVALYSHVAERNLDAFDVGGNPLGVTAELGTLTVTRPTHPAHPAELGIDDPLNERPSDDLALLAINPMPAESEVGGALAVIWTWRALDRPQDEYRARLAWLDADGEPLAASLDVPLTTGYPTSQWKRHDVWRGIHLLHVPGGLEAGDYEVAVQVIDPAGEAVGDPLTVGEMAVTTPPRTFEEPALDVRTDAVWENGIALLGYRLSDSTLRQGEGFELVLVWQPEAEVKTSLTVFVHLVNEEGGIVAQRDHIPAVGARPTTGWASGEVIEDPYTLRLSADLDPGRYWLRVGWYDALTGERVPLADGGDTWRLPATIRVSAASD